MISNIIDDNSLPLFLNASTTLNLLTAFFNLCPEVSLISFCNSSLSKSKFIFSKTLATASAPISAEKISI